MFLLTHFTRVEHSSGLLNSSQFELQIFKCNVSYVSSIVKTVPRSLNFCNCMMLTSIRNSHLSAFLFLMTIFSVLLQLMDSPVSCKSSTLN